MVFVKRTKPNVLMINSPLTGGDAVRILPGVNALTDEQFAKCKENRVFNRCFESGVHVMVEEAKAKKPQAPNSQATGSDSSSSETLADKISGMNVADAVKIIAEILNKEDLEAIQEVDTRKGVQKAVEEQLEKLEIKDEDGEE